MRRRHILLGTLALAVVLVTIGGVAYVLHARAQAQADEKRYPGLHGPSPSSVLDHAIPSAAKASLA